jgi:hypothetical protein
MEAKYILVLLPVLILPWLVLFFLMMASNKKVLKNYSTLTEKYSLQPDLTKKIGMRNHPSVSGVYRNRQIKVESVIRDSLDGKKVIPHTVLCVECSNMEGFTFSVFKRNRKNSTEYSAGSSLVEDAEFDNKFIIRTNNPEKMKRLFDFNTRFKLDQVHALGFEGRIDLQGNFLTYMESGLMASEESRMRTELVLHELCDIAEVMKYN